jgi:DNA-binding transcriptional MerR regulator
MKRSEAKATPKRPRAKATRANDLVKMSVLARMSGVPAATIKHYVKEGLLPAPARTSRNMAYYDAAFVPRIQRIKELQRTRFLPLKVIKRVLDEAELDSPEETMTATIARVLEQAAPDDRRTAAELVRAGLPAAQLDFLVQLGAVSPTSGEGDARVFAGDDLEILRVLGAARTAGLTAEMLPFTIMGEYAQALSALVRAELRMFREGVLPRAGSDVSELTEAATVLSERLVVLMRRKMLVPTLRALVLEEASTKAPTKPRRRG